MKDKKEKRIKNNYETGIFSPSFFWYVKKDYFNTK
jgi:hypothetical protein